MNAHGNYFGLGSQAKRDAGFAGVASRNALARSPLRSTRADQSAFTLIELVMVMTLLVVVVAIAAPSLAGFFRGRALDSEARRLLSLTRQGQSRAASGGVPVILWLDSGQGTYGLEEDSSYTDKDPKAVEFTLDNSVSVEAGAAITANTLLGNAATMGKRSALPQIRFQPDGGIDESSLQSLRLSDREGNSLWLALGRNRLNYEIHNQADQRTAARR